MKLLFQAMKTSGGNLWVSQKTTQNSIQEIVYCQSKQAQESEHHTSLTSDNKTMPYCQIVYDAPLPYLNVFSRVRLLRNWSVNGSNLAASPWRRASKEPRLFYLFAKCTTTGNSNWLRCPNRRDRVTWKAELIAFYGATRRPRKRAARMRYLGENSGSGADGRRNLCARALNKLKPS